jgi:hypothetical protein
VKIFVYFIGKPRDEHSNAIAAEFLKRTSRYAKAEMREIDPARTDFWQKHASARKILLDPAGRTMDSASLKTMAATPRSSSAGTTVSMPNGSAARTCCSRFPPSHFLTNSPAPCSASRSIAPLRRCGVTHTRANVV